MNMSTYFVWRFSIRKEPFPRSEFTPALYCGILDADWSPTAADSSRASPGRLIPLVREHLISSQFFFSKCNAFQIDFTPSLPHSIRKAYRTFSDNNRCRPSSRPRLSTMKLLRASLLSFSSKEASADNIISTSSAFSPFPVSLHASSALRLASTRGRPRLQATCAFTNFS